MLRRTVELADRIVGVLTGAIVLAIAFILLLQVVGRHVLQYPLPWPEEVAGFLFVWLIFIGAFQAYRSGGLIGIDWLVGQLPPVASDCIRLVSDLLVILLLAGLIWTGTDALLAASGSRTTMLRFSWAWVYLAFPVGCALLLLAFVSDFLRNARRFYSSLTGDPGGGDQGGGGAGRD